MLNFASKIFAATPPPLPTALPQKGFDQLIPTVTNLLLFLVGTAAVIGIIYGGFTYVTSGGDENRLRQAKEAIIYSIVGFVIGIFK
jgi:hypothetical protein